MTTENKTNGAETMETESVKSIQARAAARFAARLAAAKNESPNTYPDLTDADLRIKARQYKAGMLEGGEGYNPYDVVLQDRAMARAATEPRTADHILRDIERLDCASARETGTYDPARIAELEAELAANAD